MLSCSRNERDQHHDRWIVPAIGLGLGTVLMRASIGAGASIPIYLASVGTIIALVGWF